MQTIDGPVLNLKNLMMVNLYQRMLDIICLAYFHLTEAKTVQGWRRGGGGGERLNNMYTVQLIRMCQKNVRIFSWIG